MEFTKSYMPPKVRTIEVSANHIICTSDGDQNPAYINMGDYQQFEEEVEW